MIVLLFFEEYLLFIIIVIIIIIIIYYYYYFPTRNPLSNHPMVLRMSPPTNPLKLPVLLDHLLPGLLYHR